MKKKVISKLKKEVSSHLKKDIKTYKKEAQEDRELMKKISHKKKSSPTKRKSTEQENKKPYVGKNITEFKKGEGENYQPVSEMMYKKVPLNREDKLSRAFFEDDENYTGKMKIKGNEKGKHEVRKKRSKA